MGGPHPVSSSLGHPAASVGVQRALSSLPPTWAQRAGTAVGDGWTPGHGAPATETTGTRFSRSSTLEVGLEVS